FHGLVAGFASPSGVIEEIDLRDIVFGNKTHATFKEAKNHLSGTLTVTNGTQTANLTLLGQYSTGNFSLASDGHGGTIVTPTRRRHWSVLRATRFSLRRRRPEVHNTFGRSGQIRSHRSIMLRASRFGQSPFSCSFYERAMPIKSKVRRLHRK